MSNMGADLRSRVAALARGGTAAQFTAPFAVRLGASWDEITGTLSGTFTPGNGYAHQAATLGGTGTQMSVTNALTFGPTTADFGAANAFGVFDNAGLCIGGGPLSEQLILNNGTPATTIAANALLFDAVAP